MYEHNAHDLRRPVTRYLLLAIPIVAWALHIFWLTPRLDGLSGDAKFIAAMRFFVVFGLAMVVCEVIAVVRLARRWSWWDLAAAILNLTPLYYVKVLLWGATIGSL
jgi:hypothetical protein